jgi:site-specific recombinase XerD
LTYAAVYDLVGRLRRRTGIDFDPHWCRHTYATGLLRAGTPVEVVSRLLGHASVSTTVEVYGKARELHQTGENPQVGRSAGSRSGRRSRRLEMV